jgi:hypothetical protein
MSSTKCRCGARITLVVFEDGKSRYAQRVSRAVLVPTGNPMNRPTNWIKPTPAARLWIDHMEVCPAKEPLVNALKDAGR